jgi:hypothetical protein
MDQTAGLVSGDPGRLQQIVWNLLSNAVKFTPPGGLVQTYLRSSNSEVEIVVQDSGQGIGTDFLPFVFERFRQADASLTRKHKAWVWVGHCETQLSCMAVQSMQRATVEERGYLYGQSAAVNRFGRAALHTVRRSCVWQRGCTRLKWSTSARC